MKFSIFAFFLCLFLVGCTTASYDPYSNVGKDSDDALVLLSIESPRFVVAAGVGPFIKTELGGRNTVFAIPAKVGSDFAISTIYLDNLVAHVSGPKMRIEKKGIYFYGRLRSNDYKFNFDASPDVKSLLVAAQKYYAVLVPLEAVNFSWPAAAFDPRRIVEASSYQPSGRNDQVIRALAPRTVVDLKFLPPAKLDLSCRKLKMDLPDNLPFEKYVELAMKKELLRGGVLAATSGGHRLTARLDQFDFSSFNGVWTLAMSLESSNGKFLRVALTHNVPSAFSGLQACLNGSAGLPAATSEMIAAVFNHKDFPALLD